MIRWAPWEVGMSDLIPKPAGRRGAQVLDSVVRRVNGRGCLVLLWAVAAAAELLALRPVLVDAEGPVNGLDVIFSLVGGSFAAFGLVAWRRRPDSRSGILMTATGFAFVIAPLLGQLDAPLALTVMALLVDSEIADDGIGGADGSRGSGLRGLADRVEALEGSLRIISPAGAGTTVKAELPCAS
jgi:hypothetical protein